MWKTSRGFPRPGRMLLKYYQAVIASCQAFSRTQRKGFERMAQLTVPTSYFPSQKW